MLATCARFLRRIDWLLLAVFALTAYLLSPLLATGYLCDDDANSLVPGMLHYDGVSLVRLIVAMTWDWMQHGRFFPLAYAQVYTTFYLFQSLPAYKAFIFAAVLVNLFTLHRLALRVTGNRDFALAAVLSTAALLQFRLGNDPILAFSGFLQIVFLGMSVSLYALWRHLESGGRRWLVLGVLAYAVAALIYEVAYCLIIPHALLILHHDGLSKRSVRRLLPFALVLLGGVVAPIVLRLQDGYGVDPGYRPNANATAFVVTFGRQTFAALPFSYRTAASPAGFTFPTWQASLRTNRLVFFVTLALAAVVLVRLARPHPPSPPLPGSRVPRAEHGERGEGGARALRLPLSLLGRGGWGVRAPGGRGLVLALVALALWLAPAIPIAISPKYQAEVSTGLGHLPVYISYFGVGLLATVLLSLTLVRFHRVRFLPTVVALLAAVALAATLTSTHTVNRKVVEYLAGGRDQRDNLEAALRAGLLAPVPDGSSLLIAGEYGYYHQSHSLYFYAAHAGKKLRTFSTRWAPEKGFVPLHVALPGSQAPFGSQEPGVYEIKDGCLGPGSGFAILSRLTTPPSPGLPGGSRATGHLRIFVRAPEGQTETPAPFYLRGERIGRQGAFFVPSRLLAVVDRGRDWALYSHDTAGALVDSGSLEVVPFDPGAPEAYWSGAFYTVPQDVPTARWCSTRSGILCLTNPTDRPKFYRLSLSLLSLDKRSIVLESPAFRAVVPAGMEPTFLTKRLRLPPGEHRITCTSQATHSPAPQDPRGFFFRVADLELIEEYK